MAANRTAFILDIIREALAGIADFQVQTVFRDTFSDAKVIVYPFVQSQRVTDRWEDGKTYGGATTLLVYVNAKVPADHSGTQGNAQQTYNEITNDIERAVYDIDVPQRDVHGTGDWATNIRDVYVSNIGGAIDQGQQQLKIEYQLEVTWDSERL